MPKRARLSPAEKARRESARAMQRREAKQKKQAEEKVQRHNHSVKWTLENFLSSHVPPSFSSPAEYAEALTAIQRANTTREHQKFGKVGIAVRVKGPSLKNKSERNPRDVGFDSEDKQGIQRIRRAGNTDEITRTLYNENYYFHLPKRSIEYRVINRNVPLIRKTLVNPFIKTSETNTYRMMCDAFYAFNGHMNRDIQYMTRNTWKLYDILLKKANEIRSRANLPPIF